MKFTIRNRKALVPFFALIFSLILPLQILATGTELIIFHTSDIHGSIAAHADPTDKDEPRPLIGGFAVLKNLMDACRADPANSNARIMYLDSGDYFQGTPVVDRTKGAVMIDFMNRIGVEAATLGNHEFDYSYENLAKQMEKAKFPVICCNVLEKATGRPVPFAKPYLVLAHRGFKIGIIGVDTPETPSISVEKNVKGLDFRAPEPIVQKIADRLKAAGVDFIILLSHLGYESDLKFVEKVRGIDLILGGHSHTLLSQLVRHGPENTPIVHSGSSLEYTSEVKILLKKGEKPVIEMISHPLYVEKIGLDTEFAMIEEEYLREIRIEMARHLGVSNVNLYRGIIGGDSPEGSFLADAIREAVNADLAFINFGGIRQPLFKGELNVESAFLVQPFDNRIEILNMTGAQIYDMLERAVSNKFVPMDQADKDYAMTYFSIKADGLKRVVGPDYGYLYPSNLKITFDPANEPMKRLVKVEFPDSTPLDPKKKYRVALNDFIAGGGDGFTVLKEITDREKTEILVRNALISHIERVKEIRARPEKRMFNLRLTEESID